MTPPKRYTHANDLDSWRSDPRIATRGFTHPWLSTVDDGNGEDFFRTTLDHLTAPDDVVLDLGCGHGELTLSLAAKTHSTIGIDRDPDYLSLAAELAHERNVTNTRFLEFSFDGKAQLPLPDASVTLVVNRRGPTADKWLAEIHRVARPGTPVLVMHPAGGPPEPPWSQDLPESLRSRFGSVPYDQVRSWVETPLAEAGITDHRLWWFDVPEWFTSAEDLGRRLIGDGTALSEAEVAALRRVIAHHADPRGVVLRHQRMVALFWLPS